MHEHTSYPNQKPVQMTESSVQIWRTNYSSSLHTEPPLLQNENMDTSVIENEGLLLHTKLEDADLLAREEGRGFATSGACGGGRPAAWCSVTLAGRPARGGSTRGWWLPMEWLGDKGGAPCQTGARRRCSGVGRRRWWPG